jgi:hypothetical protein
LTEDFETICRRYVAERPEAIPSLGNKMGARSRLLRAMLLRTPTAPTLAPNPSKKGTVPFLAPGEEGLVVVGDSGVAAVDGDFSELEDDGGGWGEDVLVEDSY